MFERSQKQTKERENTHTNTKKRHNSCLKRSSANTKAAPVPLRFIRLMFSHLNQLLDTVGTIVWTWFVLKSTKSLHFNLIKSVVSPLKGEGWMCFSAKISTILTHWSTHHNDPTSVSKCSEMNWSDMTGVFLFSDPFYISSVLHCVSPSLWADVEAERPVARESLYPSSGGSTLENHPVIWRSGFQQLMCLTDADDLPVTSLCIYICRLCLPGDKTKTCCISLHVLSFELPQLHWSAVVV